MKKWLIWLVIIVIIFGVIGFMIFKNPKIETEKDNNLEIEDKTIIGDGAMQEEAGDVKEFSIIAKRFEFEPNTIKVNQGDKVRIILTSEDVSHGFRLNELGINEQVNAGETIEFEFIADEKGTFDFYCSVYCGGGHGGMKGQLIVE